MSIPYRTPLSYLEGIGPSTERSLQSINLFYVFDLIRASPEQIHEVVTGTHSLDRVRRWRSMALLLQVTGVTNQWAEALVRADVRSVEKLKDTSLAELAVAFEEARQSGLIPSVPSVDEHVTMVLDATTIHYTGGINGTVRDRGGQPVVDAQIGIGCLTTRTDERGRFRLIRVPLATTHRLVVTHPDHQTLIVENPRLTSNNDLISVFVFELAPVTATAPQRSQKLSEYDGDTLPAVPEFAMSTRHADADALRERDLLVLHKLYDNGDDAQLISKYLTYEDGKFYVLTYRVPLSRLPHGAKQKDAYQYIEGQFVPIRLTPSKLAALKKLRRMKKAFAGRPRPTTPMELDHRFAEIARYIRKH